MCMQGGNGFLFYDVSMFVVTNNLDSALNFSGYVLAASMFEWQH